jgi:hypothetical protein
MTDNNDDALVPDPVVARDHFGVTLRTLQEWDLNPDLEFAPVYRIAGRKYRRLGDIRRFKARMRRRDGDAEANAGFAAVQARSRSKGRFTSIDERNG